MKDVIVTGLHVKPHSCARAVSTDNGREHTDLDANSVEQQVAVFLQDKGIEVDCNNIEACHPLPRRKLNDIPAIIMRFVSRKHKTALLKQGRKLKGINVFINKHLTKHNADIARKARHLKKQKKIQSTWTANCKVYIKLNGSPEKAKMLVIRNMEELDKFQ